MKNFIKTATTAVIAVSLLSSGMSSVANETVDPFDLETLTVNLESASASSDPRGFVSHNGKTYFSAVSVRNGRAIWSISETTKEAAFVTDTVSGRFTGDYPILYAAGDYLLFWSADVNTDYKLYAYDIQAETTTQVAISGQSEIVGVRASWFANDGTHLYFISTYDGDPTHRLFRFTIADGTVSDLGATPFTHNYDGGISTPNSVNSGVMSMVHLGGHIYTIDSDSKLRVYTIGGTWSAALGANQYDLAGVFTVGSTERVLLLENTGSFELVETDATGTITAIGGGSNPSVTSDSSLKVLQFDSSLLVMDTSFGANRNFWEVTETSTTNISPHINLADDGTKVEGAVVSGSSVFIRARIANQNERLYIWDGSNQGMTLVSDVTSVDGTIIHKAYGHSGTNQRMAEFGGGIITSLARDVEAGFEPQWIQLDGTVTPLADINVGSVGSASEFTNSCPASNADSIALKLELDSRKIYDNQNSRVIVSARPGEQFLEVVVSEALVDIGGSQEDIFSICGFSFLGDDIVFGGQADSNYYLFKLDSTGTITPITQVVDEVKKSVAQGDFIYFIDSESNLSQYQISSDAITLLSPDGGTVVDNGSLDEDYLYLVGDKVVFVADDAVQTSDAHVWVQTVGEAFAPTRLNFSTDPSVQDLLVHEGNLIWEDNQSGSDLVIAVDYDLESGTGEVIVPSVPAGTTEASFSYIVSSDVGLFAKQYVDDGSTSDHYLLDLLSNEVVSMPAGFDFEHFTAIPGGLLLSGNSGASTYRFNGQEFQQDSINLSTDSGLLADAYVSELGAIFPYSEFPYDQNSGFSTEIAFIGTYQPKVVTRFGTDVNETPAQPLSDDPEVLEDRETGEIPPEIFEPKIASTPPGNGSTGSPFTSPRPFEGSLVTDIGADGKTDVYQAVRGEVVTVIGTSLSGITAASIGGVEVEILSVSDNQITIRIPESLEDGNYSLQVFVGDVKTTISETIAMGELSIEEAAAICDGQEPTVWTQRISVTQAKAYIKCGTPGVSYRVSVQQNGSGPYDTVITRTLTDIYDERQLFNTVGRYVVRTIDLTERTRIRIYSDEEKLWQVVYNKDSFGG